MFRRAMKLMAGGVVMALALLLTGCGETSKKGDPKVDSNAAPKMQEKGAGSKGAAKGSAE